MQSSKLYNSQEYPISSDIYYASGTDDDSMVILSDINNYEFITVGGSCGNVGGGFRLLFKRTSFNVTQFVCNIASTNFFAYARILVNFKNTEVHIRGKSTGWSITTVRIESINGYCPIN